MNPSTQPHRRTPAPSGASTEGRRVVEALAAMYLVAWALLSAVLSAPAVSAALRFDPGRVLEQPWSLLSYTLVHESFAHLAVLLGLLLLTGPGLVARLGWQRFLLYYAYCAVGGAAAALVLSGLMTVPPLGGALAPVVGVVMARVWLAGDGVSAPAGGTERTRLLVLGLALAILLLGALTQSPALALPHAGGLAAGLLFLRLRTLGRRQPPVTPLPIRRVVLTRARAERETPPDPEPSLEPALQVFHPPEAPEPSLVDRLLDKISAEGLASLTEEERATLAEYARRKRERERES